MKKIKEKNLSKEKKSFFYEFFIVIVPTFLALSILLANDFILDTFKDYFPKQTYDFSIISESISFKEISYFFIILCLLIYIIFISKNLEIKNISINFFLEKIKNIKLLNNIINFIKIIIIISFISLFFIIISSILNKWYDKYLTCKANPKLNYCSNFNFEEKIQNN